MLMRNANWRKQSSRFEKKECSNPPGAGAVGAFREAKTRTRSAGEDRRKNIMAKKKWWKKGHQIIGATTAK